MLNELNNHFNETTTTNGAFAYNSTKSAVLDLFSIGGAMRNRSDEDVTTLFSKAYAENPTLALKVLFYLRDIKFGQGERRFFKLSLKHLALHNKESLIKNLHLIAEFGRWDDLWILLDTDVRVNVANLVKAQLTADKNAEYPSLLAKWMPSENASSYTTKKYARIFIQHFGTTPKKYRKLLSGLRKKINVLETKLTEKNYEDIDYSKLPARAGMIYRGAFFRNDEARYTSFLDSLSKGEVKINAGTLYPNDIVGKILSNHVSSGWSRKKEATEQEIKLFEGQWNNLTDFIGDRQEESIVMADVSGSMSGTPMAVSIALAMYISERNKGLYKDHFLTFSEKPQLVKVQGSNIVEKVQNLHNAEWGMSTNIERAFRTILDVAVKNNLPNEQVVKKIYVISDMQFNSCVYGASSNIFDNLRESFELHGYDFPNIVFWNVNAYDNTPMTMNELGVQLVSGYSPSIMSQLLGTVGVTPYEFMMQVIETDRYAEISA